MSENALGTFIAFATKDFVAVDAESVEKIFLLRRSFLDEMP
jgi:hypothetical protein